jgi:hypothetical protein
MLTTETIPSPCLIAVTHSYINERPDTCIVDLSKLSKDSEYLALVIKALNSREKRAEMAYGQCDDIGTAVVKSKGVALFAAIALDETDDANEAWELTQEE